MFQTLIKPLYRDVKTFVLDTLFPISCLVCQVPGKLICPNCQNKLAKAPGQRCIICGLPSSFGLTHSRCLTPHRPAATISLFDYHDKNVANIIIAGKYKFLPDVFSELSDDLTKFLATEYESVIKNAVLVPLPLAKSRLRWRGYNQAEIITKTLSKNLNLPTMDALSRTRVTKTQKDLKGDARRTNVANAFALLPKADVKDKKIILVDDVVTTGSTLLEAAKVLLRNGASFVVCVTLAQD